MKIYYTLKKIRDGNGLREIKINVRLAFLTLTMEKTIELPIAFERVNYSQSKLLIQKIREQEEINEKTTTMMCMCVCVCVCVREKKMSSDSKSDEKIE